MLSDHLIHFILLDKGFVMLLKNGVVPHTQNVQESYYYFMSVFLDRVSRQAILIYVVDSQVSILH